MDEETKKARYSREVEQSLRQFLNHDGPKGASDAYKENYDKIDWSNKSRRPPPAPPLPIPTVECVCCWHNATANDPPVCDECYGK